MKTTVEINDNLLRQAKELARRRGIPLRALLESALRREVEQRAASQPFVLRDASVDGAGLTPSAAEGGWEALRDMAYEGRGT